MKNPRCTNTGGFNRHTKKHKAIMQKHFLDFNCNRQSLAVSGVSIMQQLYFGKQPAFNRFGASRRGGHPAPTQYGELVIDPDQVLARVAAQHQESRRAVPVQLVCVACNALSASQQRLVKGVLVDLVIAGRLEAKAGGFVPVSIGGGA